MKYTIELPAREFASLIDDLQVAIAGMARYKLALKKTNGSISQPVMEMSSQIARMERAVTALKSAQFDAEHPTLPRMRRESVARNVGDELPWVAGRPRNDPRNPKRKI